MSHDLWLINEADKYYSDCEPTVVESGWEYEGVIDGEPEFSQWFVMNCERCNETDCEFWGEYNETVEKDS